MVKGKRLQYIWKEQMRIVSKQESRNNAQVLQTNGALTDVKSNYLAVEQQQKVGQSVVALCRRVVSQSYIMTGRKLCTAARS